MLRLTSDNHLELSGMADGKANILISVNATHHFCYPDRITSPPGGGHLPYYSYYYLPGISLLLLYSPSWLRCPKISGGRFSKEDILNKKTNLLFFGNFHKATLKEYEWGMREMMKDHEYLYGALIKDIYSSRRGAWEEIQIDCGWRITFSW